MQSITQLEKFAAKLAGHLDIYLKDVTVTSSRSGKNRGKYGPSKVTIKARLSNGITKTWILVANGSYHEETSSTKVFYGYYHLRDAQRFIFNACNLSHVTKLLGTPVEIK